MPAEVTLDLPTVTNANVCLLCCRRSRSRSNHSFQRGPPPSQLRQQQPLVPAVRPQTCHRARVRSLIRATNGRSQRLVSSLGPSEAPGRAGAPVLLSRDPGAPPPAVRSGMRPCAHPRLGAGFTSRGGGGGGGVTSGKAPRLKADPERISAELGRRAQVSLQESTPGGASGLQTGGIPTVPLNSLTSPPPSPHQDGV